VKQFMVPCGAASERHHDQPTCDMRPHQMPDTTANTNGATLMVYYDEHQCTVTCQDILGAHPET
jgi:hypothetical protein